MRFLRQLIATELIAFAGLLVCALIVGIFALALALLSSNSALTPTHAAILTGLYTLGFGALPVAIFGAPLFFLLHYHGRANWFIVLSLGVAPGILTGILLKDLEIAFMGVVCGAAVAFVVRAIRGKGPNKSLNSDAGRAGAG